MSQRIIKLGCGFGKEIVIFTLRGISIADEKKFFARFGEIKDTESEDQQSKLEYDILVDGLASWVTTPITKKAEDGEETPIFDESLNAAESVRKFFENKTDDNERLVNTLVLNFREKLQPDVVFY